MDTYFFDEYSFDAARALLARDGEIVRLRPKAWHTLHVLISRAGELVPSNELLSRVWKDQAVSPKVLTNVICELRVALGDETAPYRFIRSTPRRGYAFVARLSAQRAADEEGSHAAKQFIKLLQAASCTGSRVVCISGSSTDQKATLAAELRHLARTSGRIVVSAKADGPGEPFSVFVTLLYAMASAAVPNFPALLWRYAPGWAQRFPQLWPELPPRWSGRLPPAGDARLIREAVRLVQEVSLRTPLMVLLEDIHLSDAATWDVIAGLCANSAQSGVITVLTCRVDDPTPRFDAFKSVVWRAVAEGRGMTMALDT